MEWWLSVQSPDGSVSPTQSPRQERRSGLIRVSGEGTYSGFALPWGWDELGPWGPAGAPQSPVSPPYSGAAAAFSAFPAQLSWAGDNSTLSCQILSGPFKQQKGECDLS